MYAARRARDFAPYGGKTIPKRGEFWNGRIRRVPHAAKQLDCKAINVCSTHFFVFHLEHRRKEEDADVAEVIEMDAGELLTLQKALALACRVLADNIGCPMEVMDSVTCSSSREFCEAPECSGCWRKYFFERAQAEQVCRQCGCTQYNACPGGCSWAEIDLCSSCAAQQARIPNGS